MIEMRSPRLAAFFAAAILGLVGCATTQPTTSEDPFSALYDGESLTAFGTALPVSTLKEAEKRGDTAVRNGEMDRALFEYIRGLKLAESPSARVLFKIGTIHDSRDKPRLAKLAYEWALKADPSHQAAAARLATVLLRERRYEEAESHLKPIVESNAPFWRAYNALGVLCDLRGEFEQAAEHYGRAIALRPGSAVILNNLGYSRYLAGDLEGAREALKKALEHSPQHELAWRNLGLIHAGIGDYEEAIAALSKTSTTAEAYNDLGYLSMIQGNYPKAAYFLDEAMRLSPVYYKTANENAQRVEGMLRRSAKESRTGSQ